MIKKIVAICILNIVIGSVSSQDTTSTVSMITNRPGATEASTAVFKRGFQIETGIEFGRIPDRKGSTKHSEYLYLPNFGFQYGVSDNVEFRIFATNYATRSNVNGGYTQLVFNLSSVYLGTKINLTRSNGLIPEMALLINQGIPSNPSDVRKQWPTTALLAWSYSLPANLGLSGNLGYINQKEVFDQNITFDHSWSYTLNVGYALKENLGIFAEVFGEDNMNDNTKVPVTIDGGGWFRFNPKFQMDASAGYGFEFGSYYVNAGFSYLILNN